MKENFFKVGYSACIQKQGVERKKWTSILLGKILEHKFIITTCLIILAVMVMNLWLIFRFINNLIYRKYR